MARNVAHTSASQTVDGSSGQNNRMERGGSVSANPIWKTGVPNSSKQRFDNPTYAQYTGPFGQLSVRETPFNQHGQTGKVEPAKPQPKLRGHNAAPHTKRP